MTGKLYGSGSYRSNGRFTSQLMAASKIQAAFRAKAPKAIQKKTISKTAKSNMYKLSKPMKNLVMKEINADKPNHWGQVLQGDVSTRWGADGLAGSDLTPLVPGIEQVGYDAGTILADIQEDNLNSRSGKTIKLKTIQGKLNVYWKPETQPYSGDIGPGDLLSSVYVRVLTLSAKNRPSFKQVIADWNATLLPHLFLDQNTKPFGWVGQPEYVYQPVNRQLFTVHQDQVALLKRGSIVGLNLGTAPPGSTKMAHMPAMGKQFNIAVKCKNKILNYDEGKNLYPTNFGPFVVVLYSTAFAGSSAEIQNTAHKHGSFKMTFEA